MPWHSTIKLLVGHFQILHKHYLQFLLGVETAPREAENNASANFWGNKQRALWYVMVFSVVVTRAFSHDVMAAILVFQNNETAAMLVYQAKTVGIELVTYVKTFFCSNELA